MVLDIRLCQEGKPLEFSYELALPELEFFGVRPFVDPVTVTGAVREKAGVIEFEAVVASEPLLECGRCAELFRRRLDVPVSAILAESLEFPEESEDSGIVLAKDGYCDVDGIVVPALILEMDMRYLCREDCKGLCPQCGARLNDSPCGCPEQAVDPRLSKLREYFE